MLVDISMLQKSRFFNLQQMITNQISLDICWTWTSYTNLLRIWIHRQHHDNIIQLKRKSEFLLFTLKQKESIYLIKHWLFIFGYRRSYNTPDSADKLNTAKARLTMSKNKNVMLIFTFFPCLQMWNIPQNHWIILWAS